MHSLPVSQGHFYTSCKQTVKDQLSAGLGWGGVGGLGVPVGKVYFYTSWRIRKCVCLGCLPVGLGLLSYFLQAYSEVSVNVCGWSFILHEGSTRGGGSPIGIKSTFIYLFILNVSKAVKDQQLWGGGGVYQWV